mmetsp:Transcript_5307/g.13549  ORF Transcript_5307/g.13549 Transcript_5307/m.13549 type:complete len:283 (-) Transcript_5307:163-1011(-)
MEVPVGDLLLEHGGVLGFRRRRPAVVRRVLPRRGWVPSPRRGLSVVGPCLAVRRPLRHLFLQRADVAVRRRLLEVGLDAPGRDRLHEGEGRALLLGRPPRLLAQRPRFPLRHLVPQLRGVVRLPGRRLKGGAPSLDRGVFAGHATDAGRRWRLEGLGVRAALHLLVRHLPLQLRRVRLRRRPGRRGPQQPPWGEVLALEQGPVQRVLRGAPLRAALPVGSHLLPQRRAVARFLLRRQLDDRAGYDVAAGNQHFGSPSLLSSLPLCLDLAPQRRRVGLLARGA